jgi:phospholipase/lecithinase/hemolysin
VIFLLCSAIDLPDLILLLSLTASLVSRILQMLIESGARKFIISNVGALGCTPFRMTTNKTTGGTCVQSDNTLVSGFNTALKSLIDQLNHQFPQAKFILANAFDVLLSLCNNPATNGKSMSLLRFTCASKISIDKCFTKLCLEICFPK